MENVLFRKVKLVDPGNPLHGKVLDILVKRGTIVEIEKGGTLKSGKGEIEKEGGCLSLGWVDFGVHLNDPGTEWKDDLRSLAASALAGGYTAILTLPNTLPVIDHRDSVAALLSRSAALPIRVLPMGALTLKNEGKDMAELYDMQQAGAVAFSDGKKTTESSGVLLRALQYCKPFKGLVIDLPVDMSISGESMVSEGKVSVQMGLKGSPALAENLRTNRNLSLLEYFSGRLHLGPVTTAGSVESLRRARKSHNQLSAGTTISHLVENEAAMLDFDNNYKVWPPLRETSHQKVLRKAVNEGTVDVIASGHCPQGAEEKNVDFVLAKYGMLGLESCFALANTELVEKDKMSLDRLIECIAINPRQILRQEAVRVEKGATAELTWFDPKLEWQFEAGHIRSKSKNTPYLGRKFKGKALGIYAKGRFSEI